jgi:hypothetical protein
MQGYLREGIPEEPKIRATPTPLTMPQRGVPDKRIKYHRRKSPSRVCGNLFHLFVIRMLGIPATGLLWPEAIDSGGLGLLAAREDST